MCTTDDRLRGIASGLKVLLGVVLSACLVKGCCSNPPRYMAYTCHVQDAATGQPISGAIVLVPWTLPSDIADVQEHPLAGQALQDYLTNEIADGWLDEEVLPDWVRRADADGAFFGNIPLKQVPSTWLGCPDPQALKHPSLAINRLYMYVRAGGQWQEVIMEFSDNDIQTIDGRFNLPLPAICVSSDKASICGASQ